MAELHNFDNTKITSYSSNLTFNEDGEIILDDNHGMMYLWGDTTPFPKNGELSQVTGKTPIQAFKDSYASGRNRTEQMDVLQLIIFDKDIVKKHHAINKRGFDKTLHERINFYHSANQNAVPFYVDINKQHEINTNQEALIGFDKNNTEHVNTFDALTREMLDPENAKSHATSLKAQIAPRGYQGVSIEKAIDILMKEHTCLMACFPGWGKSTMAVYIAVKLAIRTVSINPNEACNMVVLSPIVDTLEGFVEAGIANNYSNIKINVYTTDDILNLLEAGVDIVGRMNAAKGEINLIVLSVQAIRYADQDADFDEEVDERTIRERYSFLTELPLFIQITDEAHTEYGGKVTKEVFENIVSKYKFPLTATGYGLLQNGEFTKEQVVNDNLLNALKEKKAGNEHYQKFPKLGITIIEPTQMIRENEEYGELYTDEEDWDPRKWFEYDNNDYIYRNSHADFLNKTLGAGSNLGIKKNPMTITGDTSLSSICINTLLIVVPEGTNGQTARNNVEHLVNIGNDDPRLNDYHFVSSYKLTNNRKLKPKAELEKLAKKHKKRIAIVTHRKMTTGSDVPKLGVIILLDKISSPLVFEQLMGRLFRRYDNKESAKLYSFVPGMKINHMLYNMASDAAKGADNPEQIKRELYATIPVTLIDYMDRHEVTYDETYRGVLEETNKVLDRDSYTQSYLDKFPGWKNAIQGFSFVPLGSGPKGTQLSKNNKSKTTVPVPKSPGNKKSGKKDPYKKTAETLTVMLNELNMIGYINKCSSAEEVYTTDLAKLLFTDDNCDMILQLFTVEANISEAINIRYKRDQEQMQLSKLVDIHDTIFRNEKYKSDMGLVYTSFELVSELLTHACIKSGYERAIRNGNEYTIMSFNSLSGSFPLVAKELYPEARIICIEWFPYYINHLRELGFEVIDLNRDIKQLKGLDMKFDTVIGNPPFQSTTDGSKRKKAWTTFAKKSFDLGTVIAMVTPTAWQLSNSKYFVEISDLISSKLVSYNDANSHFTVGEDIGYWICDKNTTNPVEVIDTNPCSPVYKKMLRTGEKWHYRDFQQPENKEGVKFPGEPTGDYNIPMYWTAKQIRYCRPEDVKYTGWKVIVNNSGHFYSASTPDKYSLVDDKMTVGLGAWGIAVNSEQEGKNALTWIRSKLYRTVVTQMKTGGFNNPFIELEHLGTSKQWTDEELYKHFNLTQEEIDYIESNE